MSAIDPTIARQAVEWMVELQSPPVDASTYARWRQWRAEAPQHEAAWQRIEAFSQRFAGLDNNHELAHATLDAANPERRRALKALALLVASGGALWAARDTRPLQGWRADVATGVGEQRRLVLEDGTRLLLNTDTAVALHFDAGIRQVRLLRGEVFIQTAKDARPFWLVAREGRAQPLGTRFSVREQSGFCRVAVTEGAVALYPGNAEAPVSVLKAGQQALFNAKQVGPSRALDDADHAWTDGIIIASDQRLEDFLRELARYRHGHLACTQAASDVRVSGTFPVADSDRILQTLAATLDLRVRRFTPYWVTLDRR